jgi:hypothetical protein
MPTLWAHGLYMNNASTVVAPTLATGGGGYPLWQSGVIVHGSLFGGLQVYWERVKWWARLLRRIAKLPLFLRPELDFRLDRLVGPVETVKAMTAPVIQRRSFIQWLARPTLRRVKKAPVDTPLLLVKAGSLLNHPAYPMAQAAVRRTARTLGFNRPEAWQGLSRQMKQSQGTAENLYRHLQACQWTREVAPSTLTNPDCNLLVELAYHEFALRGE